MAFLIGGQLQPPTVTGAATANPVGVMQAAQERKAAEDAAAAEQKRRDDAVALEGLEVEVRQDMQTYFDDRIDDLGTHVIVHSVSLVPTGVNMYEGMAKMSAGGGDVNDVKVHLTADDRRLMWSTDQGALLPLFR